MSRHSNSATDASECSSNSINIYIPIHEYSYLISAIVLLNYSIATKYMIVFFYRKNWMKHWRWKPIFRNKNDIRFSCGQENFRFRKFLECSSRIEINTRKNPVVLTYIHSIFFNSYIMGGLTMSTNPERILTANVSFWCVYLEMLEMWHTSSQMDCIDFLSNPFLLRQRWPIHNTPVDDLISFRIRLSFRGQFIRRRFGWYGWIKTFLKRGEFLKFLARFKTSIASWKIPKITSIERCLISSCRPKQNTSLGVTSTSKPSKTLLTKHYQLLRAHYQYEQYIL